MGEIELRRMVMDDFQSYFEMKADPTDVLMSGFSTAPARDHLRLWLEKEMMNPNAVLLIAENNKIAVGGVGYLFLRVSPTEQVSAEISYGVAEAYRGQGIGGLMLRQATRYVSECMPAIMRLICWVAETNVASIQNVSAAGFTATGETRRAQFLAPSPRIEQMRKFILAIHS